MLDPGEEPGFALLKSRVPTKMPASVFRCSIDGRTPLGGIGGTFVSGIFVSLAVGFAGWPDSKSILSSSAGDADAAGAATFGVAVLSASCDGSTADPSSTRG